MSISALSRKKVYAFIQKYSVIAVFRHESPDFDALGTQFGLVSWIKSAFPNKVVYALGDEKEPITFNGIFPAYDQISDDQLKAQPFLAIVVDTSDTKRICDKRYALAETIVKLDHHMSGGDEYGKVNIVDTSYIAASEILSDIITHKPFSNHLLSRETARYFYVGIVGDSGRFQYPSTSPRTFKLAAKLIGTGFDIQKEVYSPMYTKSLQSLKITAHILTHFTVTPKGVGYFHFSQSDLAALNMTPNQGSEFVNTLSNIREINVWVSFIEDVEKKLWRVSFRSKEFPVNEVALLFNGGGHRHASGARADNYDQTLQIIAAIEERL